MQPIRESMYIVIWHTLVYGRRDESVTEFCNFETLGEAVECAQKNKGSILKTVNYEVNIHETK